MESRTVTWLTWKAWLGLFALGLALWLTFSRFPLMLQTAGALFAGYLLGLVLRPPVNGLERRFRVPRILSGTVALLLFFAVPIIILIMLAPFGGAMIDLVVDGALELLDMVDAGDERRVIATIENLIDAMADAAGEVAGTLLDLLNRTLGWLGDFVLMLGITTVLASSMAVEPDLEKRFLNLWVPPERSVRVAATMDRISHRLSQWAVSQLATMVFFGVAFGLGLALLGVPFAAPIALFGGF